MGARAFEYALDANVMRLDGLEQIGKDHLASPYLTRKIR